MNMKRKRIMFMVTLLCAFLVFLNVTFVGNSTETSKNLIFVGGQLGGSWALHGAGIVEVVRREYPEIRIDFVPGAGLSNIQLVSKKEADLGFAYGVFAKCAEEGIDPFDKKWPGVQAICTLGASVVQVIALANAGIDSIAQIKEEKIPIRACVGEIGGAGPVVFNKLFAVYGMTFDDVISWGGKIYYKEMSESNPLMISGAANIRFAAGSCPMSAFQEIENTVDLKLLPIDESVIKVLVDEYGYGRAVIRKGSYSFVKEDIPTVVNRTTLICSSSLPEEIVYEITKAIVKNLSYIFLVDKSLEEWVTKENMWQMTGVPLHPGAERYYREIGAIK